MSNGIDWSRHKNDDGEINLLSAYADYYGCDEIIPFDILNDIMDIQPVRSRQVAALAMATARELT